MQHHITADEVPLLWTQPPRFIEMMRSSNSTPSFQHPHYFWYQSDKLTVLLNQLLSDTTSFTQDQCYQQARDILSQLLSESQGFSRLTREQLRHLEPNVRTFIDKVQNVDALVQEWDARRQMALEAAAAAEASRKQMSRKRGREEEDEMIEVPAFHTTVKRRKNSFVEEMMALEAAHAALPTMVTRPWDARPKPMGLPLLKPEISFAAQTMGYF